MSFKLDFGPRWEQIRAMSSLGKIPPGSRGPKLVLQPGYPPRFHATYDPNSRYLQSEHWLGTIMNEDGSLPNKNVRNRYYPETSANKSDHIAKTPLHAIRWAILEYTQPGDTVLDPFMGSGTTGVEALDNGRKTIGVELEFPHLAISAFEHMDPTGSNWKLYSGKAQEELARVHDYSCQLVNFSNPYPDGGDHSTGVRGSNVQRYKNEESAGLMASNGAYWNLMKDIQDQSCKKLVAGGHAVFVIKDMGKNKKVWELHRMLADLMPDSMEFVGSTALPHYPASLHMSTYEQFYGIRPPMEQVVVVFRKVS